jgi:hypothetical protein
MRLVLLVMVVALGIDAYAYSGAFTQATVNVVSSQVRNLASRIDANTPSERPTPPRPIPDRDAG